MRSREEEEIARKEEEVARKSRTIRDGMDALQDQEDEIDCELNVAMSQAEEDIYEEEEERSARGSLTGGSIHQQITQERVQAFVTAPSPAWQLTHGTDNQAQVPATTQVTEPQGPVAASSNAWMVTPQNQATAPPSHASRPRADSKSTAATPWRLSSLYNWMKQAVTGTKPSKTTDEQETLPSPKKPEEKKTERKPEEKKTETKPEEKKTETKPEEKKTEMKPEEKKTETKPEEKKTEKKHEEKKTEKKHEEKKTETKPEPVKKKKENVLNTKVTPVRSDAELANHPWIVEMRKLEATGMTKAEALIAASMNGLIGRIQNKPKNTRKSKQKRKRRKRKKRKRRPEEEDISPYSTPL